jgi:hypothetical protein
MAWPAAGRTIPPRCLFFESRRGLFWSRSKLLRSLSTVHWTCKQVALTSKHRGSTSLLRDLTSLLRDLRYSFVEWERAGAHLVVRGEVGHDPKFCPATRTKVLLWWGTASRRSSRASGKLLSAPRFSSASRPPGGEIFRRFGFRGSEAQSVNLIICEVDRHRADAMS